MFDNVTKANKYERSKKENEKKRYKVCRKEEVALTPEYKVPKKKKVTSKTQKPCRHVMLE